MDIQGFNNYLIYPDGRVYNKKYERFVKTRQKSGSRTTTKRSKNHSSHK